ncbi:hypothetical protein CTEN210_12994 [Chaetoceros tenuissimus]|uniref:Uncharacterized protein n=1 Tax=Chaetoceros tenuissimus TaxID=426638 RepID=A0AAD3D2K9_9STRA|nr:hypothetical protein CTEN210_12994 [Chaetoceros tenuissimus]
MTIAVGAPGNRADSGYVEIYTFDGVSSSWKLQGEKISGDSLDYFGKTLSLRKNGKKIFIGSGNKVVEMYKLKDEGYWNRWQDKDIECTSVPTSLSTTNNVTAASIIEGEVTLFYTEEGKRESIRFPSLNTFGFFVSLSSNGATLAVGVPVNDTNLMPGHVQVYNYNGSTWNLKGNAIQGKTLGDSFGYSISLSSTGDRVAIGAPTNSVAGTNSGEVRIYSYDGSKWELM